MKILYYDLETKPILGYAWGTYQTDLLTIEQDSGLLCFAYKINDGATRSLSLKDYTEKQMVKELWRLFDEADVLIAQNGDRFDMRVANKLFLKHGLNPPSPYKTVDTLKLARKYFKFDSNKLDHLARYLLGERKVSTGGMSLWIDCMNGHVSALRKMERYCRHDVNLLYQLYHKLKGWHTGHPNHNIYNGTTHKCPNCGGPTQRRGVMITKVRKYQRYACQSCGAWSKGEIIKVDKVIS